MSTTANNLSKGKGLFVEQPTKACPHFKGMPVHDTSRIFPHCKSFTLSKFQYFYSLDIYKYIWI